MDYLKETELKLQFIAGTMSGIHEALPGKDNREAREKLLPFWRKQAIAIGYERFAILKQRKSLTPVA